MQEQQQVANVKRWKDKLKDPDQACYQWLADNKSTMNINIGGARNAHESLVKLLDFWKETWDRETGSENALEETIPFLPSPLRMH